MCSARIDLRALLISLVLAAGILRGWPAIAYPWVYYFERPDMPYVHCAIADSEGNILAATGDWNNTRGGPPGYYWREYWSRGIFLINEDRIEPVSCPENTYVWDCASDDRGTTWVLYGLAEDYLVEMIQATGAPLDGSLGASRECRSAPDRDPSGADSGLALGYIRESALVESPGLIDKVPPDVRSMCSDPRGRIFLIGCQWRDNVPFTFHITWGNLGDPASLKIFTLSDVVPGAHSPGYPAYKPDFGPDGIMYLLLDWYLENPKRYGVLCLNPDNGDWQILDAETSPFLDSKIEYFHVDERNIRWFGTEDGLVLFDGQSWSRLTTDDGGLPHNIVRQIEYDPTDDVYYVVSSDRPEDYYIKPSWTGAFTIFSTSGELLGEPLRVSSSVPELHLGSADIWYLLPRWQDGIIYAYDHEAIARYRLSDWVDTTSPFVGYIGPTSDGRTFYFVSTCVMVW